MFANNQHFLHAELAALRHEITVQAGFIQRLTNEGRQKDIALQHAVTVQPAQKTQHTQTERCSRNVVIKEVRKPFSELSASVKRERMRETEGVFREVAELLEGGNDERCKGIDRVRVLVEYCGGIKNEFWAKGGDTDRKCAFTNEREAGGAVGLEGDQDVVAAGTRPRKAKPYSEACIHKIIRQKYRHRISYSTLRELRLAGVSQIPPEYKIQEEAARLSTCLDITPIRCPTGANGGARNLQALLEFALKVDKYSRLVENGRILLRFACDGAKIAKTKDSVTGTIKILPFRSSLQADTINTKPEDELTLFFYMGKEERQTLQFMTKNIFRSMREAAEKGVEVGGKTLKVEWLFCSDWKAMQTFKGVNPANSHYFCLWCECTKAQILDFSVEDWPVTRSRTRQEQCLQDGAPNTKGYNNSDLLPFIPFTAMIPDDLHLRMRITNKLLNQVVTWAILQKLKEPLVKEMQRIGVNFRFFEEIGDDNAGKVTKWTQPGGDTLQKILGKFKLSNVFGVGDIKVNPSLEKLTMADLKSELANRSLSTKGKKIVLLQRLKDALGKNEKVSVPSRRNGVSYELPDDEEEVPADPLPEGHKNIPVLKLQDVWSGFDTLMQTLKIFPGQEGYLDPPAFKTKAMLWAKSFKRVTFDADVIPYIHCLVYHVPQALNKVSYLPDIGISQVERKNYDNHLAYFGATSRDGGRKKPSVAMQILQRENVLLYFQPRAAQVAVKRRKVEDIGEACVNLQLVRQVVVSCYSGWCG